VKSQNYANHRAIPATPYIIAIALASLSVIAAVVLIISVPGSVAAWLSLGLALALLLITFQARTMSQRLQDRLIRLEERVRYERLFPGDDRWRALDLKQVIALRFASDAELPVLLDRVRRGELTTPDQIKRAITHWQADWMRV
jgi:hypothetical protein